MHQTLHHGPIRGSERAFNKDTEMTYRRKSWSPKKIRYNFPILKKGGKHIKSRKRDRRDAKEDINEELSKENYNDSSAD